MAYRDSTTRTTRTTPDPWVKGASLNPRDFKTERDWIAGLRTFAQSRDPRPHQIGIRACPEHLLRWAEVWGDAVGAGAALSTSFAIGEGCRMVLAHPAVDQGKEARKVISEHGSPEQYRAANTAFAFDVSTPEGYGSRHVTFKVTAEHKAACDALSAILRVPAAEIGLLTTLAAVRPELQAERRRLYRYLRQWAATMRKTAQEVEEEITMEKREKARKH